MFNEYLVYKRPFARHTDSSAAQSVCLGFKTQPRKASSCFFQNRKVSTGGSRESGWFLKSRHVSTGIRMESGWRGYIWAGIGGARLRLRNAPRVVYRRTTTPGYPGTCIHVHKACGRSLLVGTMEKAMGKACVYRRPLCFVSCCFEVYL